MQVGQIRKYFFLAGALSLSLLAASLLHGQTSANASTNGQNSGYAQNPANSGESVGPTASELISGTSTSVSGSLNFDTSVGWNFSKHFGA